MSPNPAPLLFHSFIAVKRYHNNHGNSNKRKQSIGACLKFQMFSPLLSRREAWQHADRHGAGGGAESSTSGFTGSRKTVRATGPGLGFCKPQIPPPVTRFLHQGHTYPNKTISANPFKQCHSLSLQMCEPLGAILIQITTAYLVLLR